MINNGPFGIDHPLITVRDLEAVGRRYEALGFDPTPVGHHPWGTSNRLMILDGNFLELISMGDSSLLAHHAEGARYFGRHIAAFQAAGEGVSFVALHSRDVDADEAALRARGLAPSGRVEFRRPVRLPNGESDEAVVTLLMLVEEQRLAASHFLCRQHKPALVWNPQWARHRNGASRIVEVAYAADAIEPLLSRFQGLYGSELIREQPGGFDVQTAAGRFVIRHTSVARKMFNAVEFPAPALLPAVVAITVCTNAFERAASFARQSGCGAVVGQSVISIPPAFAGNVVLRISAD